MNPAVLFVIGVVLVFTLLIYIAIKAGQKASREQAQIASSLGFQPVESPPAKLVDGINRLHSGRPGSPPEVRDVFHQRDFKADYYLFGLVDESGDESTWHSEEVYGVISPQLSLPRFYLSSLPPVNRGGFLGNLMSKMLDRVYQWAASYQDLTRLTFPDKYDFDEHYVLFVKDSLTSRHFFTDRRLSSLTGMKTPFQILGVGDIMTVSHLYPGNGQDRKTNLKSLYRDMRDLFSLFSEDG